MTISCVGFDGSVTEAQWAKLLRAMGQGAGEQVVTSGYSVSVGVGTRAVEVSSGEAFAAGVLATNDAAVTVTLAANSSGVTRHDLVVLEINWATNAATVKAITGSSVKPNVTQTAGTLWQVPLAEVLVPNGATVISAGNIKRAKPLPRVAQRTTQAIANGQEVSGSSTTIATLTLEDPGWPYTIVAYCRVRAECMSVPVTDGFAEVGVLADGSRIATGVSASMDPGGLVPVQVMDTSGVLSGQVEITVVGYRVSLGSTNWQTQGGSTYNRITLLQIPA